MRQADLSLWAESISKSLPGPPSAAFRSPWLGVLVNTRNLMQAPPTTSSGRSHPRTIYVQAKTYYGGGEWYTLDLDYPRILADAGYTGYVSLEMEAKEDPDIAVPMSIAMLREAFNTSGM